MRYARRVRVVLAPDSFKESLSAAEAAAAMERGVRRVLPYAETLVCPVADGGEGTLDVIVGAAAGWIDAVSVTGPLGAPVIARLGLVGDGTTAIVEMAQASGLGLVPLDRRDPLRTTSRGTGELIRAALDRGVGRIVVAVGGSATNDAGAGALQALGAALLDATGKPVGPGGGALTRLARIDLGGLDPRLRTTRLDVACDVTNPLVGPTGASAVFGPQKGAPSEAVALLDANLRLFAEVVRRDAGLDVAALPGAGAAGGLGAALVACGGRLLRGIDLVLDLLGFDELIRDADAVITGEGRLDAQTPGGKALAGVVARAARQSVAVIALAGRLMPGFESLYGKGLSAAYSITPGPMALAEALAGTSENLERAAGDVARLLALAARGGDPVT
jgi:glycerate 2-kinase